jgi:uncharacterized protein YwgA
MIRDEYYILRLIKSASPIRGRKKLQKLFFIMKYMDLPVNDRFFMHYYGPYSADLALQLDEYVKKCLLQEKRDFPEYSYHITEEGKKEVELYEKTMRDPVLISKSKNWERMFKLLSTSNTYQLELASTILYWVDWGKSLEEAMRITEAQKHTKRSSRVFQEAIALQRKIVAAKNNLSS